MTFRILKEAGGLATDYYGPASTAQLGGWAGRPNTIVSWTAYRHIGKLGARTGSEKDLVLVEPDGLWTVEDHLRDAPAQHVTHYHAVESTHSRVWPVTVSPSKTTITFKGARRGIIGARPTRRGVQRYLDLTRSLVGDRRILSSSP